MPQKKTPSKTRLLIVNSVAVMAYGACALQWLLALLPYGPLLVRSDFYKTYVEPQESHSIVVPAHSNTGGGSWIFIAIAVLLVVGIFIFVAWILFQAPKAIGETGHKITTHTAEAIMPVMTHHVQLTEKKQRSLTAWAIVCIKLLLVIAPFMLTLFSPSSQFVRHELLNLSALILALWTLLLFGLEYILARLLRVTVSRLW